MSTTGTLLYRPPRQITVRTIGMEGKLLMPLQEILGMEGREAVSATLDTSSQAEALAWTKVSSRQYNKTVIVTVQEGISASVNISMELTESRIEYKSRLESREVVPQEVVVQQVQRAVNREVNRVLASTIALKLEEKVRQRVLLKETVRLSIDINNTNRVFANVRY